MRYLVIVIISAFVGFVGAWLLFDATVSESSTLTRVAPVTGQPAPPVVIYKPVNNQVTFDDIGNEPHVFNQLMMAWQLAAQSDVSQIESLIEVCLQMEDPLFSNNITSNIYPSQTSS